LRERSYSKLLTLEATRLLQAMEAEVRVFDVMKELFKFTLLPRDFAPYLVDRYSEHKETAVALPQRVKQAAL
jgi:hypothetical protein